MHASENISIFQNSEKNNLKKATFDACNAMEDQYTMVASTHRQPWGLSSTHKSPITTRFISHENGERIRVQALGLAITTRTCAKNFSVITLGSCSVHKNWERWRGEYLAFFLCLGSAEEKWEKRAFFCVFKDWRERKEATGLECRGRG